MILHFPSFFVLGSQHHYDRSIVVSPVTMKDFNKPPSLIIILYASSRPLPICFGCVCVSSGLVCDPLWVPLVYSFWGDFRELSATGARSTHAATTSFCHSCVFAPPAEFVITSSAPCVFEAAPISCCLFSCPLRCSFAPRPWPSLRPLCGGLLCHSRLGRFPSVSLLLVAGRFWPSALILLLVPLLCRYLPQFRVAPLLGL